MASIEKVIGKYGDESWMFWCDGCKSHHSFQTKRPQADMLPKDMEQRWRDYHLKTPVWTFNGNADKPTFSPSLLVRWGDQPGDKRCHLYLRDGMVQYLGDCTHDLKGKTVPVQSPA